MGTKAAQCSTGTKGTPRTFLSTLHPNTTLKPNPDPNTHPNPTLSLVLTLPLPLALTPALILA